MVLDGEARVARPLIDTAWHHSLQAGGDVSVFVAIGATIIGAIAKAAGRKAATKDDYRAPAGHSASARI